jgi:hypothetical protein
MLKLRDTQHLKQLILLTAVIEAIAGGSNTHAGGEHGRRTPLIADANATEIPDQLTGLGGQGCLGAATL